MGNKVLKKIITSYLKKFAEPRIKEVTGLDVETSLWGVNRYEELSGTQGKIFVDFDPIVNRNTKEGKEIEKIIKSYTNSALKFLNQENEYRVYVNQRSLNPIDEQVTNPNSEYIMLERLLTHKKYEDNGIIFKFANVEHEKNKISIEAYAEVPKGRGWNEYMLEFFAYNIINEKIKFVDSHGNMDVKLDRIYVNGTPIKRRDYYLPINLENKLENIFNKIPDFGISYKDFGVLFKVKYSGNYDIENDDYQIVVNCGIIIEKIILKKHDSDKKVVVKSISQDAVESLYIMLMEDGDTEMEELRYHLEGLLYQEVFAEAFSLHETEENYLSFYLIPQKICGKEISSYTGGDMNDNELEEYFRRLVSKSVN